MKQCYREICHIHKDYKSRKHNERKLIPQLQNAKLIKIMEFLDELRKVEALKF